MNDEIRNGKLEIGNPEAGSGMRNLQIGNENPACQSTTMSAVYAGGDDIPAKKARKKGR